MRRSGWSKQTRPAEGELGELSYYFITNFHVSKSSEVLYEFKFKVNDLKFNDSFNVL